MLTFSLHCLLNDKNIFHINFTRSLAFQWKILVMAKHGEVSESKILVYVQQLITQLCPLRVHKHGFIVHNRFITINCSSAVHYDILLQRTSLQTIYRGAIYRFSFARYRNKVSLERYLGEYCTDISMIYRFNIRQSIRCVADISAIKRENKARYSLIIICITFAQYCIVI